MIASPYEDVRGGHVHRNTELRVKEVNIRKKLRFLNHLKDKDSI